MDLNYRYHCALGAALVIIEFLDSTPGAPQYERLSKLVFSILHAMDRYEEAKEVPRVEVSAN
jgi:hypothetical protein